MYGNSHVGLQPQAPQRARPKKGILQQPLSYEIQNNVTMVMILQYVIFNHVIITS